MLAIRRNHQQKGNHRQEQQKILHGSLTISMHRRLLFLLLIMAFLVKQSEPRVLTMKRADQIKQEDSSEMLADDDDADDKVPEVLFPVIDFANANDDNLEQSESSKPQHLDKDDAKFMARQLAKASELDEFLRPRALRWLLRTEALKKHPISADGPQGLQFAVKRVVSESELNSLLKNAWLGRK